MDTRQVRGGGRVTPRWPRGKWAAGTVMEKLPTWLARLELGRLWSLERHYLPGCAAESSLRELLQGAPRWVCGVACAARHPSRVPAAPRRRRKRASGRAYYCGRLCPRRLGRREIANRSTFDCSIEAERRTRRIRPGAQRSRRPPRTGSRPPRTDPRPRRARTLSRPQATGPADRPATHLTSARRIQKAARASVAPDGRLSGWRSAGRTSTRSSSSGIWPHNDERVGSIGRSPGKRGADRARRSAP
jgi:hypothetical protein